MNDHGTTKAKIMDAVRSAVFGDPKALDEIVSTLMLLEDVRSVRSDDNGVSWDDRRGGGEDEV